MMKLLILGGLALAIVDPILLYFVYSNFGLLYVVVLLIPIPIIGLRFVAFAQSRLTAPDPNDPLGVLRVADSVLLLIARLLLIYPGPLSKVFGFLLVFPVVRRIIQAWALHRLKRAIETGAASAVVGGPGVTVVSGFGGMPGGGPFGPGGPPFSGAPTPNSIGGLKQAEGRVVDNAGPEQLPPGLPDRG